MQHDGGHFPRQVAAYTSVFSGLDLKTNIFHHCNWSGSSHKNWFGVFAIPDHAIGVGKVNHAQQLEAVSSYFEDCFTHCIDRSHASLALFPTLRFLTVDAAVAAVESSVRLSGAILGVMETTPVPDSDNEDLVRSAFCRAAERIQNSEKAYLLTAESMPIRAFLVECGFPVNSIVVHPYPAAHRFKQKPPTPQLCRNPECGALGGLRQVQNPELAVEYLVSHKQANVGWTLRADLSLVESQLGIPASNLREVLQANHVRLFEGHLDQHDYDQILRKLDVLVLPYGKRYQTLGSGMFLEALCAGIVPLVPAQSTMRALYLELGGDAPAIDILSVVGIDKAVNACLSRLPELHRNAGKVREAWLRHSSGPVAWRDHIAKFTEEVLNI